MSRSSDLGLSLTGSQISTTKRPGSASGRSSAGAGEGRPGSARRPPSPGRISSSRPTSSRSSSKGTPRSGTAGLAAVLGVSGGAIGSSSISKRPKSSGGSRKTGSSADGTVNKSRTERFGSTGDVNGFVASSGSSEGANVKHKRGGSFNPELSHRSNASEQSTARGGNTGRQSDTTDDFLALFDTNHQPVIKNRSSAVTKPRKNTTVNRWDDLPSGRAFPIPVSARSSSTIDSFTLNSVRQDATHDNTSIGISQHRNTNSNLLTKQDNQVSYRHDADSILRNSLGAESINQDTSRLVEEDVRFVTSSSKTFHPSSPTRTSGSKNKNSNRHAPQGRGQTPPPSRQSVDSPTPHRQPVEQNPLRSSAAEDYIQSVNDSATKIQRWYRKNSKRRKDGEVEIRRILNQKKMERELMLEREAQEEERGHRKDNDRKRAREEKQRQARHAAIEELQRKREEKQKEIKEKAEQEIKFLQASGKISKKPGNKGRPRSSSSASNKNNQKSMFETKRRSGSMSDSRPQSGMGPSEGNHLQEPRPGTASSVGRKVDEIFSGTSTFRTSQGSPRTDGDHEDNGDEEETVSAAATKTTLNDLLDTLKLLEEPVNAPAEDKEKMKSKGPAWLDILDDKEEEEEEDPLTARDGDLTPKGPSFSSSLSPAKADNEVYLSAENLQQVSKKPAAESSAAAAKTSMHALLTEDKLKNIMSFLDQVELADVEHEKQHEKTLTPRTQTDVTSVSQQQVHQALLVPSAEELQKLEQASAAASEVTNTVLTQRLQLEEKERSVKMLQKALNQQRELTVRHAKEQDKEMKKRLDLQKEEYEAAIKRHLSFIDQLIDDKKALSEKYDMVVKELKQMDKKYTTRIKTLEDTHGQELTKIKEVQAAAEKIKREKWIDEKTKKIKEITVKGLEPEIQRLIANHKAETKKLKSIHEAELLQAEERAGQKYIRHTEELRDQLADEKEAACARERELAKNRYEKQLEQEEAAYQQQRRRLYSEIQEEKERMAETAKRQRQEGDRLQMQMEENNRKTVSAMKEEYEQAREEQERRHRTEVKELEERLKIEKQSWEENYMKKQETVLVSKERELREQVRRDRDKEIELVITRLEDDAATSREEAERTAENRVKRIRDKYEAELKEIELSERNTQERYNELKAKLGEVEGENIRLGGLLKQKEQEVDDVKKVCDRLTKERNNVQEVIRQEFADRLVATEEENKRLKNEMSEMRARHKLELQRIQESKEEEMEEVHKRVKQAIVKKEETVNQLKQQHAAAVKRADHLESLLEQQRKQLIKKK
ncbi:centrosomal protein of 131 kDa-like [Amphiura filiformis]|uniref:centrosomal protein of 131 kDa-like n=1 Tax=Amphiura filiformis TaxID=82378 RepID=UPI003B20E040